MMECTRLAGSTGPGGPCLSRISTSVLLRVKLTLLLTLAGALQVTAAAFAQQQVTLQQKDLSVLDVLRSIKKQTGYLFICDAEMLKDARKVDINLVNAPMEKVLEACFRDQPLTYAIVNKTIIVRRRALPAPQMETGSVALAQPHITVTGRVTDNKGQPVPGARIMIQGTSKGVITDANGNYSIQAADNDVLLISFMGFKQQQVPVGGRATIDVVLEQDVAGLDEVVVVGYGTQKKVNLTGAVSSVNFSEVATSRPITSLSAGLAGLSAGISVKQGSGQPGKDGATLRIRGQGTLNVSDPLVVIDGVPGNMNDVNPQDVENISILKDAASAAIYGSRAANGVILVTTKRGRQGKTTLSYNYRMSRQSPSNLIEMVSNYPRHMELINEGFNNATPGTGPFQQSVIDEWRAQSAVDPVRYPNTDWFDWILQPKWAQEHNISVTGGSEKATYLLSGNYLNSPGLVEKAGFERYSVRINLESKVNNWLTVGTNTFGIWSTSGLANIDEMFSFTAGSVPGITPRDPQGRYGSAMAPGENLQANNYLWNINSTAGNIERQKVFSKLYSRISLIKGLSLESSFSIDFDNEARRSNSLYIPRWNFQKEQITNPDPGRGSVSNSHRRDFQYVMNHILRYSAVIRKHGIDLMAGYQEEYYRRNNFSATRYDPLDESTPVLDVTASDPTVGGNATDWAMRSFFGRVNYNFAEKYLLEANLRYDGSSRFARDRRWGVFPSFSAGWRLSEESFMRNSMPFFDDLKLRASWGSLGNNAIGNYDYQPVNSAANYSFGGTIAKGAGMNSIANTILTWEKTNVTNIGIDAAVLDYRLRLEADWFNKRTNDILIDLPIPLVNGNVTAPKQNAAVVLNRGVEFTLTWQDQRKDFSYGASANFSYVKNKVLRYKGNEYSLSDQNILLEDHPIWSFYVREVDRIVQESDMDMINKMVAEGYTFNPGIPKPGDFLYKDLNGDKKINDDDRKIIDANNNPVYLFGLNLNAGYKGVQLGVLLQGAAGNKAYWRDGYMTTGVRNGYLINQAVADNHWTPDNTDARYPRLTPYTYAQNLNPSSDFWLQDASYLRVKNIQLGYTLPSSLTQRIRLQRLFVYVNAENLFTITGYEGLDPEIIRMGGAQTNYPTMKQLSIGLNVTF